VPNNGQVLNLEQRPTKLQKRSLGDCHYRQRITRGAIGQNWGCNTKIMLGAPSVVLNGDQKDWRLKQAERGPVELTRWENLWTGWSTVARLCALQRRS